LGAIHKRIGGSVVRRIEKKKRIKSLVMNPDHHLDVEEKTQLRRKLGFLYGLGRPMTELEVQRNLEAIENGGLVS